MTQNISQAITSTPLPPVPSRFTRPARDAGLLVSSSAVGSLTGALVALMFSNEKDRGRMLAQGIVSGALTGSGIGAVRINTAQNRDTASLVKQLRAATSSKGASDTGAKPTTKETTTMNIEQLYRAGMAAKKAGSAATIGGAIGGAIGGGVGGALQGAGIGAGLAALFAKKEKMINALKKGAVIGTSVGAGLGTIGGAVKGGALGHAMATGRDVPFLN